MRPAPRAPGWYAGASGASWPGGSWRTQSPLLPPLLAMSLTELIVTPRDVTPQATQAAIDYEGPGLAEAMRAAGRVSTPFADLSRGVVGVIGTTLVVNLPGSPRGAMESLAAIEGVLDHALETLAGPHDHDEGQDSTA